MASDDRSDDGPSIAPPSIGFGLRRRKKADPTPEVEQAPPVVEQQGPPGPSVVETPAPERRPEPEPLVRAASTRPTTIFDVVTGAAPASAPVPAPEPEPEPESQPEPQPTPEPETEAEPETEPDDATAIIPGLVEEPTQVVEVVEVPTRPAAPPPAAPVRPVAPPTPPPPPAPATQAPPGVTTESTEPTEPARPPRETRTFTAPSWLVGRAAAVVIGALVGLIVVGSTALALQGCEAVQGTTSCGTGPGFFLLVVILALAVTAGAALLRLTGVADGTAISVLGVVLMVVIALLFLLGSIFDWWMVIAIPLICAATFTTAHWTTVAFADVDP